MFSHPMRTPAARYLDRRRITAVVVTAGLVPALAACGGSSMGGMSMPSAATPSGSSSGSATRNAADVTFVQGMFEHHNGAVAMAQLASSRAGSQQVKDLAAKIAAAQIPEQQKMKELAAAWGVTLNTQDMSSMPSTSSMPSMSSMNADITALSALSGTAFDREFLTRMIAHHETALPMAQAEVAGGANPEAKKMAQDIITTQTAEIAQMKTMLTAL